MIFIKLHHYILFFICNTWEQRKVFDLLELLTDYDANGSFADMAKNVNTTDGDGYAWYVRITDLENPKPLKELKYVDESSYKFLKKTELHGGELLMAKRGDIGKVYIFEPRTKYATVAPNMYLLKLNNKVIPHFLYDYFVSNEGNKKLTRLNASSTMGALYKDDVKNIDVIMPSTEEQTMIGNFFQSIDNLITLHQRKYFIIYNKLITWEQRKLGEICSRVQGNDGRMELPTLTISAANGWMKQEDRFSGNIAGKEQKNYTLLHKGELSYNHGNSKLAKYGTVFSLQTYEEALVPRVYHSFKVEIGSADFIEYYFATKMPDRELRKLISSGARMDGLLNIGYDDFMGIKMMFPSVLEQDKIAEYFRAFDHLITLHRRAL